MNSTSPRKSLRIMVVTRNLKEPDNAPREKEINYYDSSDRTWLAGHCTWALNNGHSVTTYPL